MGTWTRCAMGVLVAVGLGCGQHYEEGAHPPPLPKPEVEAQPAQPAGNTGAGMGGQQADATGKTLFSGTIRVADKLRDRLPGQATLFIFARPAPTGGPPLAVKRIPMPPFPYKYTLTDMDGMMGQGVDLSGIDALYVSVRLDLDGSIGPPQPGDMEGECPNNPVAVGTQDADIVIDTLH